MQFSSLTVLASFLLAVSALHTGGVAPRGEGSLAARHARGLSLDNPIVITARSARPQPRYRLRAITKRTHQTTADWKEYHTAHYNNHLNKANDAALHGKTQEEKLHNEAKGAHQMAHNAWATIEANPTQRTQAHIQNAVAHSNFATGKSTTANNAH